MRLRIDNRVIKVDSVSYTTKFIKGKLIENIEIRIPIEQDTTKIYDEITMKYFDVDIKYDNYWDNIRTFIKKHIIIMDAYEKIAITGLSFMQNNEEVYFHECSQEQADDILDIIVTSGYIALLGDKNKKEGDLYERNGE